jgi:hypothetical protein
MYFVVLFVVVFLFLTFMAWRFPMHWPSSMAYAGAGRHGASQGNPAPRSTDNVFARMLKGEHKEEEPCLTPIDCVQSGKCAGHCGCH